MGDTEPNPLDIPAFLKRDGNNESELVKMLNTETTERPPAEETAPVKPKSKANGHAPVKAAGKPAVKKATKAPTKAKTAPKAAAKAAKPVKATAKVKVKTKTVAKAKTEPVDKDQFGFRKGTAKSDAAAMYARKSGATLAEVKEKLGSVQLNVLVGLEEAGHKVKREKETRKGQRAITRYFLATK